MRRCLLSERIEAEKPERPPWMALVVLVSLGLFATWQIYLAAQQSSQRDTLRTQLQAEPGYILIEERLQGDTVQYEVLRDYRARLPATLKAELSNPYFDIDVLAHEATLGTIDLDALRPPPPPSPSKTERYRQIRQAINDSVFLFNEGTSALRADELPTLARTLEHIHALTKLADELDLPPPQLLLLGLADPSGSQRANLRVSQQRAETLRALLRENGIDQNMLIAWGLGDQSAIAGDKALQRRVSIQVIDASEGVVAQP